MSHMLDKTGHSFSFLIHSFLQIHVLEAVAGCGKRSGWSTTTFCGDTWVVIMRQGMVK
jgi:hypothetical protein